MKGVLDLQNQQTPFALKLGAFVALSEEELSALDKLHRRRKKFAAGLDMVHQGQVNQSAYILWLGVFLQAVVRRRASDR